MASKSIILLLLLCFLFSITVVTASSYDDGYQKGSIDGLRQAQKDCNENGCKEILSKIPFLSPDKEYNHGYLNGFLDNYHKNRFEGLKK
jgi:hypothetical protein